MKRDYLLLLPSIKKSIIKRSISFKSIIKGFISSKSIVKGSISLISRETLGLELRFSKYRISIYSIEERTIRLNREIYKK